MTTLRRSIVIEPSSYHFSNDELFNTNNTFLNRDGTLLPFGRLQAKAHAQGIAVHTADKTEALLSSGHSVEYWSLGILNAYRQYIERPGVTLRGFMLMEPPLVAPGMYAALPELTRHFQEVFVHNTQGDGYSLAGVDQTRLRKLYWPQPYASEAHSVFFNEERLNKLVVIAGAHNPKFRRPELYSQRIQAVANLQALGVIDLYGRGWDKTFSRHNAWWPYWKNRSALRAAYQGACPGKMDVLGQYRFSLCFENMPMLGYMTEKIFDCLYSGTVPVYWGAQDIEQYIPEACYVKYTDYPSSQAMWSAVGAMSHSEWQDRRQAIRDYLASDQFQDCYVHAMERITGVPYTKGVKE